MIANGGKLHFEMQSLVCLFQDEKKQKNNQTKVVDPSKVVRIICIQRNEYGQIYLVQGLERSLHFTIATSEFPKLVQQPYPSDASSRNVPHFLIKSSSNYISGDKETIVYNATSDVMKLDERAPPEQLVIKKCTQLIIDMFDNGLSDCFCYLEKKRSGEREANCPADDAIDGLCGISFQSMVTGLNENESQVTSSSRSSRRRARKKKKNKKKSSHKKKTDSAPESALPTITCGWTTNDANQYQHNRSTIASTLKPFLRDGGLPFNIRTNLLDLIEFVLKSMPKGSVCFEIDREKDSLVLKFRKEMAKQFASMLGKIGDDDIFRVEGIAIIIPLSIAAHRDTLNCFCEGMSSVLQINARIPLNNQTIKGGRTSVLWKWLETNGYSDWFPCTVILYARKCVYDYCVKMAEMRRFSETDSLRRCLNWALLHRVDSVVDYHGSIWNNDKFQDKFMREAKIFKNSRFGGIMMELTASYDKTVSTPILHNTSFNIFISTEQNSPSIQCYYSIIAHVFFDMNVNFIQFTVADCLDFIAYCGFQCNGTVLIAEIHRRIMSNTHKYDIMHSDCGSMYQFLIAVNKEITDCCPGSCTQNRFTFSQGSNNTAWESKRSELLKLCAQFFEKESTLSRQANIEKVSSGVIDTIVKSDQFPGAGAMGANQFLHLSALFGLVPLSCFNYAEVKSAKLGPSKLITCVFPQMKKLKDVRECFESVHKELKDIWGPQITKSLLENTFCELSRCINATKAANENYRHRDVSFITDKSITFKESPKTDLIFFDQKKKSLQNFFRLMSTSKKASPLRPILTMKLSSGVEKYSAGSRHKITNWCQNKDDPKLVYWTEHGREMKLCSKLETTHEFDNMFLSTF